MSTQRIELSSLFLHDDTEVIEMEIPKLHPGNVFKLRPIRDADRRRWQKQFKLCRTCGGLTFIPIRDHASACPTCGGGRIGQSFDDVDVRRAVLKEICLGWSNWFVNDGSDEIPFTEAMRDKVAEFAPIFYAIREAADGLLQQVETEEGKD
jgi:hypothetical protein